MKYSLFIITVICLCSCAKIPGEDYISNIQQQNLKKINISQGIAGTISFMEGDCMPGNNRTCNHYPVKRVIMAYELTDESEANPQQRHFTSFYDSFNTSMVKETTSDEKGFYQMDLPAGHYTLVVSENQQLYSASLSIVNGKTLINPITVDTNVVHYNFVINYKAYF